MVLVVKAYVPGKEVEDSVVRVRFWNRCVEFGLWTAGGSRGMGNRVLRREVREDIMLSDEVACTWVQRTSEE